MGFKFTYLCDLLSSLEDTKILKATPHARNRNPDIQVVSRWFARHDKRFRDPDTDRLALLSCMFPEKRTDRVYWLQDTGLARVIGRCLLLGSSRREELERWRVSGGGDLGQCVENVMRQAENHIFSGQEVTVDEIDYALNQIASRCRFSGPKLRRQRSAVDVEGALSPLYRRLGSRDAKWLTRMILKSHFSDIIPEKLTLKSFHFLLPHLLLFQDSFEAAVKLLSSQPICHFPSRPEPGLAKDLGLIALHHLIPNIGTKIGRPEYYKARSIKHCCNMVGQTRMSVERKYDGEYCQIHIDLSKNSNSIQIFSKSGKDSTTDRIGVHQAIIDSLRIGKEGCKFTRRCILEGELLVWSDKHQNIMPFHKLRKFVSRSGLYIGTESDSPPQPYERLMIVFFDILLLDNDICLRKPHRERRLLLKDIAQTISGLADIADQRVIDFSRSDGRSKLETLFAAGIAERWEGFILKGCEDPYFPILIDPRDSCFGRWIKLKKDYIPGLGDTLDLALVGATYNARDASVLGFKKDSSWTHFFVGCLENKEDVLQSKASPRFRVVDVLDHHCMSQQNLQMLNTYGKYGARSAESSGLNFDYARPGIPRMDVVFKTPFVVEVLGSGFEKPSGARFYALRFPRILKIHSDRSVEDTVSFRELQLAAEAAVSVQSETILEEEAEWAQRVKSSTFLKGYLPDDSERSTTATSPALSRTSAISPVSAGRLSVIRPAPREAIPQASQESPTKRARPQEGLAPDLIPIYVDRQISSGVLSSAGESPGPASKVLGDDGKLPSQGNPKKRKASHSSSAPCSKSSCQVNSVEAHPMRGVVKSTTVKETSSSLCLALEQCPLPQSKTDTSSKHLPNEVQKATSDFPRSPFSTVPIYISPGVSCENLSVRSNGLHNVVNTWQEFVLMLTGNKRNLNPQKRNTAPIPQTTSFGIIFANNAQTPLGVTLLQLSKQISEAIRAHFSKHSSKGRIFILNSQFLQLDVSLTHRKFRLRKTWEKISLEYFYACIAWELVRLEDPLEEIPATPWEELDEENPSTILEKGYIPRLRISFDRKDIMVLGEYTSLDPSVRIGAE
ncbi:hypothetical protein BJY04DRAFT_217604 [Aspergillus karnatakaensis]|uniref:ATP dependent DNA ligase domain protein n=1 Tax=Aspergillus karnatakaensis TaxID=1810916 RepID=UPI003CCDE7B3